MRADRKGDTKATVKVFCTAEELAATDVPHEVIARYKAFQVVTVPRGAVSRLRRRFPVEDISDQYALVAGTTRIDTAKPRVDRRGRRMAHPSYRGVKGPRAGAHHYLVQFVGPVKSAWLAAVRRAGGEVRAPYGGFTFVVRANERTLPRIAALPSVRWVGHLPHEARVSPGLLDPSEATPALPRTRHLPEAFTVEFFGTDDARRGAPALRRLGVQVLRADAPARLVIVRVPGSAAQVRRKLAAMAAVHGVRAIFRRVLKRPSNDVATKIMATAKSTANSGAGLTGKGEIVGICDTGLDTGDPATIHPDFKNRILSITSYPVPQAFKQYATNPGADDGPADVDSGHGTHVSGSVLGDGTASASIPGLVSRIRGLAREAQLVFQAVEQEIAWKPAYRIDPDTGRPRDRYTLAGIPDDLRDLFGAAYKRGVRVHSDSWGGGDPGAYDAQCRQLDEFVWTHKDFCVLVAAGNDGTDADANGVADGKINLGSVTSPGTAKNCITVGACESRRPEFEGETYGGWWPDDFPRAPFRDDPMADDPAEIVAFSSRGPTRDGRFSPDVVAPGTFILSTRSTRLAPNNFAWHKLPSSSMYFFMGGTSMATPLTAGATTLLRQYFRTARDTKEPSAALLKAALVCGATRLDGYGPAGAVVDNHQGFGRVTLDAVVAPIAPRRLVFEDVTSGLRTGDIHEWKLRVNAGSVPLRVALAYSDYPGKNLVNNLNLIAIAPGGTRFTGNQATAASLTLDAKNNVEVIGVKKPATGTWRIQVVGSNVAQGTQDFALVAIGAVTAK